MKKLQDVFHYLECYLDYSQDRCQAILNIVGWYKSTITEVSDEVLKEILPKEDYEKLDAYFDTLEMDPAGGYGLSSHV